MKKHSWSWFKEMLGFSQKKTDISEKTEINVEKPYKSAKLIGNTAIFVLENGETLEVLECKADEWVRLLNCKSQTEMLNIIIKQEPTKELKIDNSWELLKTHPDFEVNGNVVKFKGINRSLPLLLINKFVEVLKEEKGGYLNPFHNLEDSQKEYVSYKNFWFWLCLNPFPQVINRLYDFLHKNDFKITKDGMFLAYRRVLKVGDKKELVEFISNSYVKIKAWKKSPKNFWVWGTDDGDFELRKFGGSNGIEQNFGNLAELYLNIDQMEENRYTDGHTQTFDIRIGRVVSMPRKDCTYSQADCMHSGLHFSSKGYDYSSFGDTGILMLVNPANVVGIGDVKGRTSEYLPLCTLPADEERNILSEEEFSAYDLQEYYATEQLEELEERVKTNYITELEKNTYMIPSVSSEEIKTIIHNLQEIVKRKVNDITE